MSDNRREAELLIDEVEEDAESGLTIDQRLIIASVRASLAQVDMTERQVAAMTTANENASRMVEILTAQADEAERAASPTSPAPVHPPAADEHADRPGDPAPGRSASTT